MTKEQAIKILEKLLYAYSFIDYRFNNMLEVDETNAIQYILSDYERILKENKKKDKQIEQYQNMLATNDMLHVIECENKDKKIDLMANEIDSLHSSLIDEFGTWETEYSEQGEEATIEQIKQYYENKAKELLNK